MDAAALDLLPDGVVIADRAGVRAVNAVAAAMLGRPADELVGRSLAAALTLTDQGGHGWVEIHDPFGGLAIRTAVPEQRWLLADGTEVLVNARLHRERRGGPVTSVGVALRSARGRERLDRERSDLVATVAHELRSPLTGVKGFVHALLNRWDKLNDDQKKLMLTTASVDADRLSRLIAELLDVARLDTGRLRLNRRTTDLAQKAEGVVASIGVATSRTLELTVEDRPLIEADPDKVIQVITNVVENAVRHGEGTVRVRVASSECATRAEVVVTDEGEGIPEPLRARAFTKFWTSATGGGSGLGLYIVNGLVRAHGGDVVIDDAPGGGAEVRLTWPLGPAGP
ncbi:HAMP domain-containing histidine kinase [Nocardioides sp. GY 10113]|uniref:sensor histidine kinase n=1 Tax=Nocardioides sp. GY 10113 TaxID=2569761 RepID=UPI0010A84BFF|nr:HAMP domain-containing sensor histidine kinase [Nocardioides sp. GY 10113]TIC80400.1 HAMP domain-containing histidine kinase [Nocardioides sp. GY 10113]TIC82439.1 HAMP domain-containing histidine kinase [Nocardioides sp. GY 10113]